MELFKFFQEIDLNLLLKQKEYLVELQGRKDVDSEMLEGILTMLDKAQDISEILKKNPAWHEELWLQSDLADAIDAVIREENEDEDVEITVDQIERLRDYVVREEIFSDLSDRVIALENAAAALLKEGVL